MKILFDIHVLNNVPYYVVSKIHVHIESMTELLINWITNNKSVHQEPNESV